MAAMTVSNMAERSDVERTNYGSRIDADQRAGQASDAKRIAPFLCRSTRMRKTLRGYAKDKNGNLILIGTMPVPISKDKCAPALRKQKRHLIRQGATIFRKEMIR
jgi:hypothetical protein